MNIKLLKYLRLLLAISIYLVIGVYYFYADYYNLPDQTLMITIIISLFVFLLGLQYHLEKRPGMLNIFLMLFSVIMLIMSIIGIYIT